MNRRTIIALLWFTPVLISSAVLNAQTQQASRGEPLSDRQAPEVKIARRENNRESNQERCSALRKSDFESVLDATTQLTKTTLVAATDLIPEHCKVEGYVAAQVGFELLLPMSDWNGKFFMYGCGGFCGVIYKNRTDFALRRGYATVVTDMGHKSTALDGKWAYNNRSAEIDFGYRATHVVPVAAKAIIDAFYRSRPKYSYYLGCSTGGRQGMVAAQRYPKDFDGIISGAAPLNEVAAGAIALNWRPRLNADEQGNGILDPDKLPVIYQAAVKACDLNDGYEDGIVEDPLSCNFDPAGLQCGRGDEKDCLSAAEVDVVKRMYKTPHNTAGDPLVIGAPTPTSELNWRGYIGPKGEPVKFGVMGVNFLRYMSFMEDPGPTYNPMDFDFDLDPPRLAGMEALYNAQNPDLRAFKQAGGKLIMYHGNQDTIPLESFTDYYQQVTKIMEGPEKTMDFYRLFMIPGVDHCFGGPGADMIDYLSYLENWVERGEAPERLVGAKFKEGIKGWPRADMYETPAKDIEFTRPVYPWPYKARYSGDGAPKNAENWIRVNP